MIEAIKAYIAVQGLIRPGDKIIVAVSGGPDSMALLHILWELSLESSFSLVVAHINHGLRPQAGQEQEFVEEHCQRLEIPCYTKTIDVRELARQTKTSLEDAGRQARYGYFNELLQELQADAIATAHHQDDQAETVLLHLLRGAGMPGLRGIMPRNGKLIRPLLHQSKQNLLNYLQKNQISYCIDQSNQDQTFLRNRIRHQLIPLLQNEYNPRIAENLSRLAEIIRADNDFLEQIMQQYWTKLVRSMDDQGLEIDLDGFKVLPLAARRRLTIMALSAVGGPTGWEARDIEKVLQLLHKSGSAKILQLKKGIKINKSYDRIIFTSNWQETGIFNIEVTVPGQALLPDGTTYRFMLKESGSFSMETDEIQLDYDKLSLPLVLRSRCNGDVIQPAGFTGHKKLKKYLNEKKVPFRQRDQVAVLASRNDEIYALVGLCICSAAAVDHQSKNILLIKKAANENNSHKLKSR
ncbi:MAG TPA: tRNA lysidine(34) synthetase TilS [Syntrophomonas sp.]|nr:tRNA lysidine(34) synthetase TilS [Syntrophomonas sp.]